MPTGIFHKPDFKVKRRVMFPLKLSPSGMEGDRRFKFGILSPLLPSGGASEAHFHAAGPAPNSHFYIYLICKVINAKIIKSHS